MSNLNVHIDLVKDPDTGIEVPEIWKDIPGFRDRYQISNYGRVRSKEWTIIRSDGKPYLNKSRVLKQGKDSDGYCTVYLKKGDVKKTATVHRMVGITFIPNPDNKPLVLHKDGTKDNCVETNLYWGTHSDNQYDAVRHGTSVDNRGEANGKSKLTRDKVLKARRLLASGKYTHREIGEIIGVSTSAITMIKNKQRWGHVS